MLNPLRKLVFAASVGAGIASFVSVASALPVVDALAIKNAAPPTLEEVQWRGRWGWGWGRGAPIAAGVVASALVGRSVRCALLRLRPVYPGPYTRARRLRIRGIRRRRHLAIPRRHLVMLSLAILRRHLSLAMLRRRRAMPCRPGFR
jgi:hypothetical protein